MTPERTSSAIVSAAGAMTAEKPCRPLGEEAGGRSPFCGLPQPPIPPSPAPVGQTHPSPHPGRPPHYLGSALSAVCRASYSTAAVAFLLSPPAPGLLPRPAVALVLLRLLFVPGSGGAHGHTVGWTWGYRGSLQSHMGEAVLEDALFRESRRISLHFLT